MKLMLDRKYKKDTYTIGRLYCDGQFICNTVEDKDRGISDKDSLEKIKKVKVYAKTAIPTGTYRITLDIVSPKFNQKAYYKSFCNGKLPRLLNVKGFDGILIHKGSNADSSAGCIIVGMNTVVGGVTNSQYYFEKLYKLMLDAKNRGEQIEIQIV